MTTVIKMNEGTGIFTWTFQSDNGISWNYTEDCNGYEKTETVSVEKVVEKLSWYYSAHPSRMIEVWCESDDEKLYEKMMDSAMEVAREKEEWIN